MIAPNDPAIVYSPWNWDVTSVRAMGVNTGAYLRMLVTGSPTALALTFDVSNVVSGRVPRIKWRVDQGPWTATDVAASIPLTIPGNTWTKHIVEVAHISMTGGQTTRWANPPQASIRFTGLTTTPSTCVLEVIDVNALKVLVFGDSITEARGTLYDSSVADSLRMDATTGWAQLLAQTLGCEVGTVGWGSQGWIQTGAGGVPQFTDSWQYLCDGVPRSLTTVVPNLIVINHGTNDSTSNTAATQAAITSTINAMLAATPSTTKIAVMRPFNGQKASTIQAGIAAVSDPSRVFYVDTTGWYSSADSADSTHPYGHTDQVHLTVKLANALRPKLLGTSSGGGTAPAPTRYVNRGGTAVPVS